MKRLRILLVQYKINYLNIHSNLRKLKRLLYRYKFLNPDLVIFPEYALTGPLFSNYELAIEENSEILKQLRNLAIKNRVSLIPGSFIRKSHGKLFNSSCLITAKGDLIDFYDKMNLWSSEKRYLKAGSSNKLFKTKEAKISIQICADLNSSLLSYQYRQLKPDIIINTAMWSQEDRNTAIKFVPADIEYKQTEYLIRARALENRCYAIFCNFAGSLVVKAKTGRIYKETSIGNSMIVDPYGEIIARSSTNKEEVLFVQIDLTKCHWSNY